MLARLDAVAVAAKRRSELDLRARELEPSRRLAEQLDRFAQQRDAVGPQRHGARDAGRRPERTGQGQGSCKLELLGREASGFLAFAEPN